ncbi:MAG: von Willebrand factor type A domain-containing protein [Bdellovibrionaceae bacterium]|nr:von Willebrand factor type A domain-containing protein [Pseudobdellovibrionaceae bacterium]
MEKSKLTAYALNEVSEAERAEIETYLNAHPERRAEIEEIKLVSSILKSELASELVVKVPELKINKPSMWSAFFNLRVLAVGLSFAVVSLIAVVMIKTDGRPDIAVEVAMTTLDEGPVAEGVAGIAKKTVVQKEMAKTESVNQIGRSRLGVKDQVAMPELNDKTRAEMDAVSTQGAGSVASFGGAADGTVAEGRAGAPMGAMAKMKTDSATSSGFLPPGRMPMPAPEAPAPGGNVNSNEEYKLKPENEFIQVSKESLSTFSIDVDTAAYTNARRYLMSYQQIPPADSIRTEEFVNYFDYDYKAPTSGHPIAIHMEATKSPWNSERAIVRVGLKAKEIDVKDRPKSNLVFLVDVSGSMEDENKLPLVKSALKTLSEQLGSNDRISMVVYAGSSGVILDSVSGDKKDKILSAIQNLSAGGGTNGEGGIRKAYEIAQKNYISGGNNRVILASDGDFNVGVTSPEELLNIIKEKSEGGVFLTVLGFGMGNYKDARLEEISNKGQGNYFYIDNSKEADKVFVNQLAGTLYTMAKDVKVQIEFNPKVVHSYRLVGYENRMLNKEDFANDKVDAGEMGAGHSVTALYEIEWKGKAPSDIKLKYQPATEPEKEAPGSTDEILTTKIRYKKPTNSSSEYFEQALKNKVLPLAESSCSTRFAVAVAGFSQWMRQSAQLKDFDSKRILEISEGCTKTADKKDSFKDEFIDLVKKAREIRK